MIMKQLREATHLYHVQLEKEFNLLDRATTLAGYQEVLGIFSAYVRELEPQLDRFPLLGATGIDPVPRAKRGLLERDLQYFGLTPKTGGPSSLSVRNLEEGLGYLYVMEGSTLGGQLISRELNKRFGLTPDRGAAYFSGYGEDTRAMWESFRDRMEAFFADPSRDASAAVGFAQRCFVALGEALKGKNAPLPHGRASATP